MKKYGLLTSFIFYFIYTSSQSDGIQWKGYLLPDYRINYNNGEWLWNENRLSLQFGKTFEERAKITTDIWVRTLGLPNEQQWIKIPEIREAKIEIFDFLFPKLDLSIGKQRIKWGTADKINPTDNLNPHDLEDIWDFGRHKPSDAIWFKYYPSDKSKLEAVFLPLFQSIQMPIGVYSNLLMPKFSFPDSFSVSQKPGYPPLQLPNKIGIIVNNIATNYLYPTLNIKNSSFAFRASQQIFEIDFSASYNYGYDGIPIPTKAFVEIDSINFLQKRTYINVTALLDYPKFHRIGFDFTGNIKGIGIWGEACLAIPDKNYILKTYTPDINQILGFDAGIITEVPDSIIFEKNKPWIKYVLGSDYTFKNGIYANIQYLHGFLHERGSKELNDYYLIRIEKNIFDNKIKISPISGGIVINNYKDLNENYTFMLLPEFTYFPNGNTELTIGAKIIDGKGQGTFNSLKKYDEVFARIKYSF